jgi:hypothetical protein
MSGREVACIGGQAKSTGARVLHRLGERAQQRPAVDGERVAVAVVERGRAPR